MMKRIKEQMADVKDAFKYNPQLVGPLFANIRSSLDMLSSISDTSECQKMVSHFEKDIKGITKVTSTLLESCENRFKTAFNYLEGLEQQEKEIFENLGGDFTESMTKLTSVVATIEKTSKQLSEVLFSALNEITKASKMIEAYVAEVQNIDCCLCDNIGPEMQRRSEWNSTNDYLQAYLTIMEAEENEARSNLVQDIPEDIKEVLPAEVANLLLISDFAQDGKIDEPSAQAFCDDLNEIAQAIIQSGSNLQSLIRDSFANYSPATMTSETTELEAQVKNMTNEVSEIIFFNKNGKEQLQVFKSEKEKAKTVAQETTKNLKLEQKQKKELVSEITTLRKQAAQQDKEIKAINKATKDAEKRHAICKKEHHDKLKKQNEEIKTVSLQLEKKTKSYYGIIDELKLLEKVKFEGKKQEAALESMRTAQKVLLNDIDIFKNHIRSLGETKDILMRAAEN